MPYKGNTYLPFLLVGLLMHCIGLAQPGVASVLPNVEAGAMEQLMAKDDTVKRNKFVISYISISGDKKTKPYVIEREVPFKPGDSLALNELVDKFEVARRQLMNTHLFNDVVVSLKGFRGYLVDVQIEVKERWYIFPIPYFKPVDRNLSEWAKQGYGIQRVNYGAKVSLYNFTGRNDKLKAWFVTGYTRQIEFSYEQPNAGKALKHGFGINMSYATAKEINHITRSNEQQFIPVRQPRNAIDSIGLQLFHGQVLNEQMKFSLSYTYRPAIKTRHSINLSYNSHRIDEAVSMMNPKYFGNGKSNVLYPEFNYNVEYNNIDFVAYPLKGFIGNAGITKRGINKDMNLLQLYAKGTRSWEIARKSFYMLQGYGILKLPFDQPYYNQRVFGYGDLYLRGLEKYVIDGVAALMVRNTLRKELLNFSVPFVHSQSHDRIPFRIYCKTYGDMGYSYNKSATGNSLVNRMLYTGGAGIDVVTFYDIAIQFEYSCNQLGQKGLFLHFKNDF